jgi:ABC-2 type transport system permease protein
VIRSSDREVTDRTAPAVSPATAPSASPTRLGFAVGHGGRAGPLLGACLAQVPAVWVIRRGGRPAAVLDLSPFGHPPKLPGREMEWTPLLLLTALAAALVTAGLAGLRRRDLVTS